MSEIRGTRGRRVRKLEMLAVAALFTLAGCSQHQEPTAPTDNGGGTVVEVEIRNFEFVPKELHITPGTTVRWKNTTSTYHTVSPDGQTAWTQWQTATQGETFEVRFDTAGTFPYYCAAHRALGMVGSVIVQ